MSTLAQYITQVPSLVLYLPMILVVMAHVEIDEHIRERRWAAAAVHLVFIVAGCIAWIWLWHAPAGLAPKHMVRPWWSIRAVVLAGLQMAFLVGAVRSCLWYAREGKRAEAAVHSALALCAAITLLLVFDPVGFLP